MHEILKDNDWVVAIDFGTRYSGFCYGHTQVHEPKIPHSWKNSMREYSKTPTTLCYFDGKIFWGDEAEDMYNLNSANPKIEVYRDFKMDLQQLKEKRGKHPISYSVNNKDKNKTTEELIVTYLTKLKEYILEFMWEQQGYIREEKIFWLITTPASWNDEQNGFMRQIATKVGLVKENEYHRLSIVKEPEMATFTCIEENLVEHHANEGKTIIIIDAGGGTIDITYYKSEMKEGGLTKLKEIGKSEADDIGGRKVNEKFIDVLAQLYGIDSIKNMPTTDPKDFKRLINNIETQKCTIGRKNIPYLEFELPQYLLRKNRVTNTIQWKEKGTIKQLNVQFIGDGFIIDKDFTNILYSDLVEKLNILITNVLKKTSINKDNSYVYLVGGFANSEQLFEHIKTKFVGIKVIRPFKPEAAIMKGAYWYVTKFSKHITRRAKLTYGVATLFPENFTPKGKEASKCKRNYYPDLGCYRHEGFFNKYIGNGDEVPQNGITQDFTPVYKEQTVMTIAVYSSTEYEPKSIYEDSVKKLQEINIPFPQGSFGLDRKVNVTFSFAHEITVTVVEQISKKVIDITINFISDYY